MIAALVLAGCASDEPDVPAQPARRTILVYMIATNSLGGNQRDLQDLQEMDQAVTAGALDGCRLLVYRVSPGGDAPSLFEVKLNNRKEVVHETLLTYAATEGASVAHATGDWRHEGRGAGAGVWTGAVVARHGMGTLAHY